MREEELLLKFEKVNELYQKGNIGATLIMLDELFQIEKLWVNEFPEFFFQAHIISAEIFMEKEEWKEADREICFINELIHNIESGEQRIVAYVLKNITLSKYYADQELYDDAKHYILEALDFSFSLSEEEKGAFSDILIHNLLFIFFMGKVITRSDEFEKFEMYSDFLKDLSEIETEFAWGNDYVMLNFLLADIYKLEKKYDKYAYHVVKAYENEKGNNNIVLTYYFIKMRKHNIYKYVERDKLKEILFQIAFNLVESAQFYVGENINVKESYYIAKRLSGILQIIISYVQSGIIECSDEEYIEVTQNLKSYYDIILTKNIVNNDKNKSEQIKWKSFRELIEKLPPKSVFIDYVQYPRKIREEQFLMDLDIASVSIKKETDTYQIKRHGSFSIMQERYMNFFLNAFTRASKDKDEVREIINLFDNNNSLKRNLYNMLLKPALESYDAFDNLFISGDVELNYIPFSMLMNADGQYLVDKCPMALVVSLRDFNYEIRPTEINWNNAMILGYPQFTLNPMLEKYNDDVRWLKKLPFSRIEVEKISSLLGVDPVIRENANKSIWNNVHQEVFHIATHGMNYNNESDDGTGEFPLDKTVLFFAGANDVVFDGLVDEKYGNGKIFAEELMQKNLSSIKVVVMSACFSGNGNIDYTQGTHGFRTVFQAQGVKVYISSLWEVDDFAAAVFMEELYRNMMVYRSMEALRQTQLFIKNVTVGMLREAGWFERGLVKKLGPVEGHLVNISKMSDETKLFFDPKYWAGYVLYLQ